MAKLSDLIRVVALATGDGDAGVTVIARSLREAGLIATGGRGRYGADMTASDAASLLIAVGAPGDHTKAATTANAAGSMRLHELARVDDRHAFICDEIPWNLPIKAGSSLLEVATALLSNGSSVCAPAPKPPEPASYLDHAEEVGRLEGDLTVTSFSTTITRGRSGWHGSVTVRLANHRFITLQFGHQAHALDQESRGWKEASISLGEPVSTAIIACLQGHRASEEPTPRAAQ